MKIDFQLGATAILLFTFIVGGCGERPTAKTEVAVPVVQEKQLTQEDYFAELQQLAEAGNADSQFSLGWIYMRGEGYTGASFIRDIPKDPAKALQWYQKAAEQGHVEAQYNLGMLYKLGLGVKEDARQAFGWLQKAAAQGNDIAQYHLGLMYAEGTGVKRSLPRASAWLALSAAQDNERAKKGKADIDATLSPAQRAESERLAANWKKGEVI